MSLHSLLLSSSQVCREIAPSLLDHVWQSSLFACAVWALAVALRRHQARTRYWLWLAASAKFLVPFALLAGMGSHMGSASQTKAGVYAAFDEASQPFTEMTVRHAPPSSDATTTSKNVPAGATLLPLLLGTVWQCGFIGMLAFWWMQRRQITRMVQAAESLQDGREIRSLRSMERALGFSRSLEVLLSHKAMEPGVIGTLHPTLLWPAGLSERLDDAQLEAILCHELCHVRHRDNLTSAIQMAVASLFWFHPLVWWFGARLIEERERACDEEVLLRSEPSDYAKSILTVCEFCVAPPSLCISGITGADLKQRVRRIMSNQVGVRFGRSGKAALAVLTLAAMVSPVAFGWMHGRIHLYGQILHASGPLPTFEVATVRPMQPGYVPPFNQRPGSTTIVGPIKQLIGLAYNLPPLSVAQILGEPEWVAKDQYVIQAKMEDSMRDSLQKMNPAQAQTQRLLLLQSLLADRLKLKVHFETRELPMYAMVVAKSGPKLQPTKEIPNETDTVLPPPLAPGAAPSLKGVRKGFFAFPNGSTFEMQAKALSMDELAQMLQRQPDAGGRLIVNQTGIAGLFDCTMKWTTELPTTPIGERAPDSDEPPFFTAIREQVGLRLVPTKGPAEVIVIDHIERPSEN